MLVTKPYSKFQFLLLWGAAWEEGLARPAMNMWLVLWVSYSKYLLQPDADTNLMCPIATTQ